LRPQLEEENLQEFKRGISCSDLDNAAVGSRASLSDAISGRPSSIALSGYSRHVTSKDVKLPRLTVVGIEEQGYYQQPELNEIPIYE